MKTFWKFLKTDILSLTSIFIFQEVRGDSSSKQDAPQHCESMSKSFISGKDDNGMSKPFVENVCCVMYPLYFKKILLFNALQWWKSLYQVLRSHIVRLSREYAFQEIIGDNSSKQDSPKQSKFTTGKGHISGKEGIGIGKPSLEIVYDVICLCTSNQSSCSLCPVIQKLLKICGKSLYSLMKICFQEVSGDNSFKQDAPQHCESTKGKSHISEKEENRMDKPFLEIVHSVMTLSTSNRCYCF